MSMDRKDVENSPNSRGRTLYLKYLNGEQLTASQSIIAGCFCCMNGHIDGRLDCEIPQCPMYSWMPYRKKEIAPRKKKVITEEHKKKMKDGRKKNEKSKKA